MKLYWAPHSRSRTALWLLEEAGRPYQRELIDIRKGQQASPAFRAINPMMKVPALTDGEAMVAESAAICAYVADAVPEAGLAPAIGDPLRGRYLQWLAFAAGPIEAAYTQKFTTFEIDPMTAGWASFERVIEVLIRALAPGPWMLGDRFSAADVAVGSALDFGLNVVGIVEPHPVLRAYVERCIDRPAWKRAAEIDATG
ncbi:glutathione S-transferase family protein [Marinivivus vitaminiproducens]|uniref:glutathione S-transferase family protein n=1 Tax=Marinivivus vitaminiproducens TaxID=3035935 RepID=UPI0027A9719A|nr:glutathione S-transferase family protein [Geminicoccaceae bacterium SCSIO 64248]